MKELLFVAAILLFLGFVAAEEFEPGEDVMGRDADGALRATFSIDAWLNDVNFVKPVALVNGTCQIGGMKSARS